MDNCLVQAGWRAGRNCDIEQMCSQIQAFGFSVNEFASAFLREFSSLSVKVPLTEGYDIVGSVSFDPIRALNLMQQADVVYVESLTERPVCPIGTTCGQCFYIFMDADGATYLLDREWQLFARLADNAQQTIEILCDGRNARVDSIILDENRNLTSNVIRADNEHLFWKRESYQNSSRFLPPRSLSPCRRPPTWCALVNTLESILEKGQSPQQVMVTCGGITISNGKMYFVAHCENCLYVRKKAQMLVSEPPPGISFGYNTGEFLFMEDV